MGKIVLDKDLLNKAGMLSEKESEEMKRHPLIGYRILNLFNETLDIAETVFTHHERWDGKGYPKGLEGNEIPLTARIIAVAEAYDSMCNMQGDNGYGST
ncbi:MAG: HD domain-containing protein, partial [Clostridiales bacterium]|nr:HD domain-containing protein [Clostridiales bacterium]